jgi:hypothetical protein
MGCSTSGKTLLPQEAADKYSMYMYIYMSGKCRSRRPVVDSLPLCFEKAANKQKTRKEVRSGRPDFELFFLARGSRISPLQDGPIRAPTLTRRHSHEPPVSASVGAGRNSSLRYETC